MSNDVTKFILYVCAGLVFLACLHFLIPHLPTWAT